MHTTLDFLRHGEPVGGRRYRGQIDDPLSEKGWKQMRSAVAGDHPWNSIVSSPLSRCRAFAEELAGQINLPLSFDARLQEVGFGVWEGRTAEELKAVDPSCVFNFKLDPIGNRPEGAEPLAEFSARVCAGYESVLAANTGGHVLVVCHAGVMRMVMCHVLGIPVQNAYRLQIASAAMARIRVDEKAGQRHESLLWLTPGP